MQASFARSPHPRRSLRLRWVLALAVVGVVVLGGGKAAAVQQPSCGDTIITDTTLHHNLVNCPNNGIIIGADNVTLDLNYHTIDGDGTPAAGCDPDTEFCDIGVLNRRHDGVTVMHGSVREFRGGMDLERGTTSECLAFPPGTTSARLHNARNQPRSPSLAAPEAWSETVPEAAPSPARAGRGST